MRCGSHRRDCAESDEARWIRFDVSGVIDLDDNIDVGSNTTVDGRGADVTIVGRGLYITDEQNVIINDITLTDGGGSDSNDAIRLVSASRDIWIHHVTLGDYPDGLIDIRIALLINGYRSGTEIAEAAAAPTCAGTPA